MSAAVIALVIWTVFFVCIGFIAGFAHALRMTKSDLVERVRGLLNTDMRFPLGAEEATRELRTLLAIDGHRLPKRVRDAASVWLAERETPP